MSTSMCVSSSGYSCKLSNSRWLSDECAAAAAAVADEIWSQTKTELVIEGGRDGESEYELIGKLSWGSSSGGSTKLSGTVNCGKMSLNLKLPLTDLPTTWLVATWAPPCCATVCATYACCRFHWNVRIAANGDALMAVHQIEIETKIKRKIHLKCSSTQLRTSFLPLPHPMGGVASRLFTTTQTEASAQWVLKIKNR